MEEISIEDFTKIQMKVGTILNVEDVDGADKLLNLTIDIGEGNLRTILSGINEFVEKDDLVSRQCVVVSNLKTRKIKGIESNGMVVASFVKNEDGSIQTFSLVKPDKQMQNGSLLS